jgi:hypothetical protein
MKYLIKLDVQEYFRSENLKQRVVEGVGRMD